MNSGLHKTPCMLAIVFFLAQLSGCDRRPVTAEHPGARSDLSKSASGNADTPSMTGAKIYPGIDSKK